MTATAEPITREEHELNVRMLRKQKAREHPAFLLEFMRCIDAKSGEEFVFDVLTEEEREQVDLDGEPGEWFWHREILDSWLSQIISLEYKARQIGITWLAAGLALWLVLTRPGTRVLVISINLEEAQKVIGRIWGMYRSLPPYFVDHVEVTKPARGGDPSQEIEWTETATGRKSVILALPSTPKAGHGETGALVILDEFSRQDYARESWKAAFPIIDGGGRAIIISTANGVSTTDGEGEAQGNFFHYLWTYAESMGIVRRFLGVFRHPRRDDEWYRVHARALPASDRAEQYPRNPEEGFISTGKPWFDIDMLNWYQQKWRDEKRDVLYRMSFEERHKKAGIKRHPHGEWRIYEEPDPTHKYAIGADVSSGSGEDFSSAHVIDLTNARWVAEFHARVGEDVFAKDLYYAGRWYGNAKIAVETQGGWGRAVVIQLRSDLKGRKPYANMYRHSVGPEETTDPEERDAYGFPMNQAMRPLVISQLEEWIRDGLCPWITPDLDAELRTFSKRTSRPSPRALEGCNDDRVMSAGISLELFRQFGTHPKKRKRTRVRNRWQDALYPWERRD
jgi:hypothetical protein